MSDSTGRYRTNWQDEIESAALYAAIAALEPNPSLAEVYRRLAAVETEHARFWRRNCARPASRFRRSVSAGAAAP